MYLKKILYVFMIVLFIAISLLSLVDKSDAYNNIIHNYRKKDLNSDYDNKSLIGNSATTGVQKTAVLLVKFKDNPDTTRRKDEIEDLFNDVIDDYYLNCSYGKISIDADVYDWEVLPEDHSEYFEDPENWMTVNFSRLAQHSVKVHDDQVIFTDYDRLVIVNNNKTFKGGMGVYSVKEWFGFEFDTDDSTIPIDMPCCIISDRYQDGTCYEFSGNDSFCGIAIHEMGHGFEFPHLSDNEYKIPFDVMDVSRPFAEFSSWSRTRSYIQWLTSEYIFDVPENFKGDIELKPLSAPLETDTYKAIKIPITSTGHVYYLVENRRYIGFDKNLRDTYKIKLENDLSFSTNEGIVIYMCVDTYSDRKLEPNHVQVIDSTPNYPADRELTYLDESLTDASWPIYKDFFSTECDLTIDVKEEIYDDQSFLLNIDYEGPIQSPDTAIDPWDPPPWESPDIWVDSFWGGNRYGYYDSPLKPDGTPEGRGDTPLADANNRLYYRVHNKGKGKAYGVEVKFYERDLSIGGSKKEFTSVIIPEIEPESSYIDYVWWKPPRFPDATGEKVEAHICVTVEVIPQPGELEIGNQIAQENFPEFNVKLLPPSLDNSLYTKSHSGSFLVGNPLDKEAFIHVFIYDKPKDWDVKLSKNNLQLMPGKNETLQFDVLFPGFIPYGTEGLIDIRAVAVTEGDEDAILQMLGGITFDIQIVQPVDITIDVDPMNPKPGDTVIVSGGLSDSIASSIMIEFIDPHSDTFSKIASTTNNGSFICPFVVNYTGEWKAIASWYGDDYHSSAFSEMISFEVEPNSENNPPNNLSVTYNKEDDELIISAIDPDHDRVRYGVSWDNDNNVDQWTNLVSSGMEQSLNCDGRKGTAGVIAEDEYGAQSEWVSVKSKINSLKNLNIWVSRLIHRLPILEHLL